MQSHGGGKPVHAGVKDYQKSLEKGYASLGDLVVATYRLREPRQKVEILRAVS